MKHTALAEITLEMRSPYAGISFDEYIMGRSLAEYQQLRTQAKAWEFATRRVLERACLRPGMTCLDVGCGSGDVMRLMGEMTGASGHIIGLDADAQRGSDALTILRATGNSQFDFIHGTVENLAGATGQQFDIVFARLLLIHLADPVAALKKMYALTKPGGYLIIQDYDCQMLHHNHQHGQEEFNKVFFGVYETSGRDTRMGIRLPAHFIAAGIGHPDGTDVAGIFASLAQISPMMQSVYRSLLPRALQMGLTTEAASQEFFEMMANASPDEFGHWPQLIAVWKRKPVTQRGLIHNS